MTGLFLRSVAKVVEPKKAKLREAEALLNKANAELKEKQDMLQASALLSSHPLRHQRCAFLHLCVKVSMHTCGQ